MSKNLRCQNHDYIYGISQDRCEASKEKKCGYGSEFHAWLLVYRKRHNLRRNINHKKLSNFLILHCLSCFGDHVSVVRLSPEINNALYRSSQPEIFTVYFLRRILAAMKHSDFLRSDRRLCVHNYLFVCWFNFCFKLTYSIHSLTHSLLTHSLTTGWLGVSIM